MELRERWKENKEEKQTNKQEDQELSGFFSSTTKRSEFPKQVFTAFEAFEKEKASGINSVLDLIQVKLINGELGEANRIKTEFNVSELNYWVCRLHALLNGKEEPIETRVSKKYKVLDKL